MPVVRNDDKVWFDETVKLAHVCEDVQTLHTSGRSVLLLSHFDATVSQLAVSLQAKGIGYERFASLNPSDLCQQLSPRVWLGSARAFRVTHELSVRISATSLEIIVAEHHPLQSEDEELSRAAAKLSCNAQLCFYFSFDDPLMRYFGSDSMKALFERLGIDKSDCISHHLINTAIQTAQEKIERKVGRGVPTHSVEDWFKYNLPLKK